jgi:predicted lipoprotein
MPCWRFCDPSEAGRPRALAVHRRPRRLALLLAIGLVAAVAGGARAEEPAREAAYRRLNQALVDRHVLPRYGRLVAATAAFDVAAQRFCADPAHASADEIRGAFHAASDAWHDVEHLRFGPMESRLRAERLAFWPDPRNATGRQLAALIAGGDPAALTADGFLRASAAVQGLPAAERLLFDDGALEALRRGDGGAGRRCAILQAVVRNVAAISAEVLREWSTGDAAHARLIGAAGPGNTAYGDPKEATQEFLKSLYGGLDRLASLKLAKPLGASVAGARGTLAEEWRSDRALRDVRRNLAAARALYLGEGTFGMSDFVRDVAGDPGLDARLRRALDASSEAAERIPAPIQSAVADPRLRPAVEHLLAEVQSLAHEIAEHLTVALDLPLGFNALDGD